MFPALWIALAVCLGYMLEPRFSRSGDPRWELLPLALLLAAGIGAVFWRRALHPLGMFDWIQGGVVDITHRDPERLRWVDWAIAITRRGTIDTIAGRVRLERRLFFGLVPLNVVERPLDAFYRVEVKVTPRESRRRNRGFLFDTHTHEVTGYDYAVYLVDRRGDRLCVLDLSTGLHGRGDEFVGGLRQLLEEVVGRPGGPPPRRLEPPRARGDADERRGGGGDDDFEAWRAKRERGESA